MNIIGTGSALPNLAITNDMLSQFLDTDDKWISTRTGIKKRRIISTESLIDLAVKAAKKALINANVQAEELDFIICSNVANNYVTPALSCFIQGEIGAKCPCLDLNGACSGFIYALDMAEAYMKCGKTNKILIICAEEPTRFCNWAERNTSVLFGDGAGAVVVSSSDNCFKSMYLSTNAKTDAIYYQRKLENTPYLNNDEKDEALIMHGKDVFRMAVSASTHDINTVLEKAEVKADDVDYYLLHQANFRIIEAIREHLKEPSDKFPTNIEKYGNTSSASIPILLDELNHKNQLKNGNILVMSAFGAGFTTGACLCVWSKNNKNATNNKN